MAGIVLPQVIVFQQFNALPTELTNPLRAFIFGPEYALHRYSVASEKVKIGQYDPIVGNTYDWLDDLGRQAGAIPDLDYTKIYLENARLAYWTRTASAQVGSDNFDHQSGLVSTPIGIANQVRFSNHNLVNKSGYALDANFHSRDVRVGDRADFTVVLDSVTYSGGGKVIGFAADSVAASIASSTAASANQAGQVTNTKVSTQVGATPYNLTLTGTYDGYAYGVINETYTVTCVQGTTGQNPSTALFNIVSASGSDTVYGYAPTATSYSTPIPLGALGVNFSLAGYTSHDVAVGDSWTIVVHKPYTLATATSGGTYTGPSDTTYIVTVLVGGTAPTIEVTTTTGIDSQPPTELSGTGTYDIGSYGVQATFAWTQGLLAGDQWYINASAVSQGAIKTVILDQSLPTQLVSTSTHTRDLSVKLSIQKNIELPAQVFQTNAILPNWSSDTTAITIEAGASAFDSTWRAGEIAIPIVYGDVYIHWRELLTNHASNITEIGTLGDLTTEFSTPIDPDNPLVYAASKALANSGTASAPSTGIRVMAVPSNDITGYTAVLSLAEGRDDLYTFVPLTFDRSIQDAVVAHVQSESVPELGLWRTAFVCTKELDPAPVVIATLDGDQILATTDSSKNLTTTANVKFITSGVRAGDKVRLNYTNDLLGNTIWTDYVVDSITSEDTLKLVTAPNPIIGTPSRMEIWRTPTADDVVTQIGTAAGSFSSRRVCNVFPSYVPSGGVTVPAYHACAAIAGLIGSVSPQQGLTNVELVGFDNMKTVTDRFNRSQLDRLSNFGVWILTQDLRSGLVYTRHQLTTDTTDLNTSELSIVKNVDSISYYFSNILKPFIGRANITPTAIEVIRTQITSGITALSTIGFNPVTGGQVLDGTKIAELRQHAVLKDRLVCIINLVLPYPLNNIELYLVV